MRATKGSQRAVSETLPHTTSTEARGTPSGAPEEWTLDARWVRLPDGTEELLADLGLRDEHGRPLQGRAVVRCVKDGLCDCRAFVLRGPVCSEIRTTWPRGTCAEVRAAGEEALRAARARQALRHPPGRAFCEGCRQGVALVADRCPRCLVLHGEPCPGCGRRAYHLEECPRVPRAAQG